MRARVSAAKARFLQRKQSVDYTLIERDWDDYFENEAPNNWREVFHPLIVGTTRDVNDVWTAELGIQFNVQNWLENAALELEAYEMTFAQPILSTTQSDLFALLKTAREEGWTIERLNNGIDALWDVYLRDEALTDEEREWFVDRRPEYRIENISRTESMHSANWASPQLFRAYGAEQHEWVATNDARTRPTHAAAHGQVRTIGQPFEVGASLMLQPLDGSLGAPAGEIVNCRCVTAPVIEEGQAVGEDIREPPRTALLDRRFAESTEERMLRQTQQRGSEVGAMIRLDGEELIGDMIEGTTDRIAFPDEWIDILSTSDKEYALTHTHPTSKSFSVEDVQELIDLPGLAGIRVVGADGSRYAILKQDRQPGFYQWQKEFDKLFDEGAPSWGRRIVSGEVSKQQAQKALYDEVWKKLAPQMALDYQSWGAADA